MTTYLGTKQDDYIDGSAVADLIKGLGGADELTGGDGDDRILGGIGDDYLAGNEGNDTASGGAGDDYLEGGNGDDILKGGNGMDILYGQSGDDRLIGGDGDDFMRGGAGVDYYDGGEGRDIVSLLNSDANQGAVVDLRTQEVINDGYGNYERLVSIESVSAGTAFADTFYGNDESNTIGLSVGDSGQGFGGDDIFVLDNVDGLSLDGGAGIDGIGFGSFYFVPNGSGGTSTISADHGVNVDLARRMIFDDGFGHSLALVSIESVTGGQLDDRLTGTGGGDSIDGGSGDDRIVGLSGADTIRGGYGNDTLIGGLGADTFVYGFFDERGVFGDPLTVDTITDFIQGTAHKPGDKIDLSENAGIFGESHFIGTAEFSGAPGEIRYEISNGQTIVSIEADGRPGIDLSINLTGEIVLTAADFIL